MPTYIATLLTIPASILCALILVGIGLAITRKQSPQLVRRHSGADTYWSIQPEQLDRPEGVLTVEHAPRHYADDDDTIILNISEMEAWESVGRRAVDSPVRHAPVDALWMPPISDIRIALLTTPTAEYLFARKPHDQLSPRIVRPYMLTSVVQ